MNASAHRTSMEIHIQFVKNVQVLNANVKHRTNSLEEIVFWLVVRMVENAQKEPNVFRLLVVLAIALVQKDIELNRMAHVLMLMNVWKINISALLEPNVSTDPEAMNAFVLLAMMVMHTTDNVRHHKDDVQLIKNAEQMKNAYNLESVYVRHHSFWTPVMATNVKIHANDIFAVLMQNVHHLIHHNVCVRLDSKETRYKDASMKMNAQHMEIHARTVQNVSIKKVDTNVFARTEWVAIHIKVAAF